LHTVTHVGVDRVENNGQKEVLTVELSQSGLWQLPKMREKTNVRASAKGVISRRGQEVIHVSRAIFVLRPLV
jgi:hypothetical protein